MAHFTHCPYKGTAYRPEDDGLPTRVYHDDCLPPEMAEVMAEDRRLRQAWEDMRELLTGDPFGTPTVDMNLTGEQISNLNAAGEAMNRHKRYGWAPIYGRACDACGEDC